MSSHCAVKMVLYGVVCSARKNLGNFSPPIPVLSMGLENNPLLSQRNWVLFNMRVDVIMPSFSALFARSKRALEAGVDFVGNEGPLLGSVLTY